MEEEGEAEDKLDPGREEGAVGRRECRGRRGGSRGRRGRRGNAKEVSPPLRRPRIGRWRWGRRGGRRRNRRR